MRVESGLPSHAAADAPVALTIGSFDGVHRGHAALLAELDGSARRLRAETVVLTFEPHPRCVLDPSHCPPSLSTVAEKAGLLEERGIDRLVVLPFTEEVSRWTAEEFCDLLRRSFDLDALVVGHDFALGHRRQGDAAFLRRYGARWRFEVHQVAAAAADDEPVSSTRIRRLLAAGDVTAAAELLGHAYFAEAVVAAASSPGLELAVPAGKCLPAAGAYAAWLAAGGQRVMALVRVAEAAGGGVSLSARPLDAFLPAPGDGVRVVFGAVLGDDSRRPQPETEGSEELAALRVRELLGGAPV